MERQDIAYFLMALLCVLIAIGYTSLASKSRKRNRQRRQREEDRAERERLAADRIAANGGKALSSKFAGSCGSNEEAKRPV